MEQPPDVLAALSTLLSAKQYDACRLMAETFIGQEMARPEPSADFLARLQIALVRCLLAVSEYKAAAETADHAALLAQIAHNRELQAEALILAGNALQFSGDFRRDGRPPTCHHRL